MRARVTIGYGFTLDRLKNWREIFKPITGSSSAKPKQFANYVRHSIENRSKNRRIHERSRSGAVVTAIASTNQRPRANSGPVPHVDVLNGLCKHLRAREHIIFLFEREQQALCLKLPSLKNKLIKICEH